MDGKQFSLLVAQLCLHQGQCLGDSAELSAALTACNSLIWQPANTAEGRASWQLEVRWRCPAELPRASPLYYCWVFCFVLLNIWKHLESLLGALHTQRSDFCSKTSAAQTIPRQSTVFSHGLLKAPPHSLSPQQEVGSQLTASAELKGNYRAEEARRKAVSQGQGGKQS